MSALALQLVLNVNKQIFHSICNVFPRTYAKTTSVTTNVLGGALKKKKIGKLGPMMEKKIIPVETDPKRLVNYCCGSNIYKTGEDVKLLPDSEYPDWLWSVRTGPPPPIEELDPNTKEYWKRIRKKARHQQKMKMNRIRRF